MRLLVSNEDNGFDVKSFSEQNVPPYAILSHTWSSDERDEVKLQDIKDGTGSQKTGSQKLLFCREQAKHDGLQYFWVDTCCIDQTNLVELSEAINSMFRWYKKAAKCYVYLLDVSVNKKHGEAHMEWESAFRNSRWFTRGWTLQELLAPTVVEFYSRDGIRLGDKRSLEHQIAEITRIPIGALRGDKLSRFNIDKRFSWAESRRTTKEEDKAYCLLGVFDISLPLIYGEGQSKAMKRLQREIRESGSNEPHSINIKPPSHNIPFPRNRRFIGRMTILEDIKQRLFIDQDTQRVALVGLGGVGKTQTVLEFAYSVKYDWPDFTIFWIPALSMESIEQACSEIMRILKLPEVTDDTEDAKELVRQYLSSDNAGKWLLIVDNADDSNLLFGGGQQAQGLADFLPQSETGFILFTTRYQEIAVRLESDVVEVKEMNNQEAISFLGKSLVSNSVARNQVLYNEAIATELLEELAHLPLAIAQAAAYLSRNNTLSISGYLQLLRDTEQGLIHLLSQEFRDSTRYRDNTRYRDKTVENAVAKTWLVSFNQIRDHDVVAADLLSFISCIESKAIPRSILPSVQPKERIVQAIGTLCGYSFIADRGHQDMYDTHRLVHLAIGKWIENDDNMVTTMEKAIQHIAVIFPTVDFANQALCRKYLTHALRLLTWEMGGDIEARYELCLKVGQYLDYEGRITESVKWMTESSRWREENLAEEHPDRLHSQQTLATAYEADGQIKKAVELMEHVVAVQARTLAEEHPSRLASQHDLATAYEADGQIKKAVELMEHVVAVQARTLAEEHPSRLASQHNLAMTYKTDGQIKKAVELMEHVVAVQPRTLAEEHRDRLHSQHNLAMAYKTDGQIKKAVELMEHVVAVEARTLAEEHRNRLASQHDLATAYEADGQIKKAVELMEHVVSVEARTLAEEHPSRLASQHNLAMTYKTDGQIKKAVELMEHVVAVRARTLAEEHPSRLASQHNLATAYQADGQIKKAVELMEHVVAVEPRTLAEEHPSRLASQHNLATAYEADGQIKKAVELMEHVVAVQPRTLAEEHPSRLASQHALATAYRADGQIKKAVELMEHVVSVEARTLAEEHRNRLHSQHNLAAAYEADGQIKKVVELMEHVVSVEARTLAEEHRNRLHSQHNLATAYRADGQIKKAVELMEHVVSVEARTLAEEHPSRLASQHDLATAYQADGQIKKAVELMEHVVAVRARTLAEEHPSRLISESVLKDFRAQELDDLDISSTQRDGI